MTQADARTVKITLNFVTLVVWTLILTVTDMVWVKTHLRLRTPVVTWTGVEVTFFLIFLSDTIGDAVTTQVHRQTQAILT